MARPREFDSNAALENAMQVFWANGYKATSLDDLCASTGLGRSSLYAAFGDKRGLYLKALDRYEGAGVDRITAALARAPLRKALARFLDRVINDIVAGPGRSGCFIGNCAAELAHGDRTAATRVRRSLDRIQAVFRDALVRARTRGEIAANADVDALARFLVAGTQGLRLIGKAKPQRAALNDIAAVMLNCLNL